ncbi:hypothetical protein [Vibrio cholerae]|uniref:hypothetical protein n=1 Tax=Vibrio cholerae TaxID=666 RepID=UPI00374F832D
MIFSSSEIITINHFFSCTFVGKIIAQFLFLLEFWGIGKQNLKITRKILMPTINPASSSGESEASGNLTTTYINDTFNGLISKADKAIETFLTEKSAEDGTLNLSASDSLQLQKLMAEQSIAAQTATTTLKSVKDSIIAAARNI